ncbi:MAG: NAD(P)H-hydrate dehydratase [Ramlibacter sp.]|nr:NAD(P)H-hydrate dehydratase [Ramlibacter sp.]
MHLITPDRPWPLHDVAATRAIEQAAAATLPPHTLMARAGLAVARLALAVAPHARTICVACGPGNNGGDGFEAAMHLRQWGKQVIVIHSGDESRTPVDAATSLKRARDAGAIFARDVPANWDLAIDALLGIGSVRPMEGAMAALARSMAASPAPVIAIDVPSGLDADTGASAGAGAGTAVRATHTLSLLTLKPGLFTAGGRDACGVVWFDELGVDTSLHATSARIVPKPRARPRPHDSHKGTFGDVAVIGGARGMTGAALLAASAALHCGAGRVLVALLDDAAMTVDATQPELMFRNLAALELSAMSVACGCGGGAAVQAVLPRILSTARSLVLDADALNAIAGDTQLQTLLKARSRRNLPTVLTPHPLEAARLLGTTAQQVQSDRLGAAMQLANEFGCVAVLKGSGTIIAAPGEVPAINITGNGKLATGGTGDVLAGMIAAYLGPGASAFEAAADAVCMHGLTADRWPAGKSLTAGALAAALDCGSSPQ